MLKAEEQPERGRIAWADVAKGMGILLVVLWHVLMKHYLKIDWHIGGQTRGLWGTLGEQLLPLRMPLFFAVSGFFAVRAVQRPWSALVRTKVAKFYYLYVIWLVVHTVVLAFVPDFATERANGPLKFLAQLTITPSNLWYLYALALYFVIAKAARQVPTWLILGLAAGASSLNGRDRSCSQPGRPAAVQAKVVECRSPDAGTP